MTRTTWTVLASGRSARPAFCSPVTSSTPGPGVTKVRPPTGDRNASYHGVEGTTDRAARCAFHSEGIS